MTTMNRSLKTREVLFIGAWGVERRGEKWKVKGLGEQARKQFTVWEEKIGSWRANGISSNGSRKRERFPATNLAEAVEHGADVLFGRNGSVGLPELDLAAAFDLAIESSRGSADHKEHMYQFAGYFCEWAEVEGITQWDQLRFDHVQRYMNDGFERGLKAKTVSHYLEPIRLASKAMASTWPDHYRDVCKSLRIPPNAMHDGVYRDDDGNPVLTFSQVLDFVEWLEGYVHSHILIPATLLQGVCGLQLREAVPPENSSSIVNLDLRHATGGKKLANPMPIW